MATNAKEYKDLQQATSIADDALVAMADPNAPELQTSTVASFAQKIQEINTDGPLAELELATSIGKQQLAEALTEKGVSTVASETLVQMADKLRGLQTTEGTSILVSTLLNDPDLSSAQVGPSPFAYVRLANDDLVALATDTLHYIDHTLEYDNVSSMIAASLSSASCPVTLGSSSVLTYSENTKHIAVALTRNTVAFYEVDLDSKTITHVKTVELPANIHRYSSDTLYTIGITNDGKYYFYVETSKKITAYDIESETIATQTEAAGSYDHYSGTVSAVIVESDSGGTLILNSPGNGDSHSAQYTIEYSVTGEGLTFDTIQKLPYYPSYCPPQFKGYGLKYTSTQWYPRVSNTNNLHVKAYTLSVINIKTQETLCNIVFPITTRTPVDLGINPGSYGPLNDIITTKNSDGTWTLRTPGDVINLIFDPTQNTLKFSDEKYTTVVQSTCTFKEGAATYSHIIARAVLETPNGYVIGVSGNFSVQTNAPSASWTPLVSSSMFQFHSKAYKKQFAGVLHNINGNTTLYLAPSITSTAIAEGAYGIETAVVPLPESNSQEGN